MAAVNFPSSPTTGQSHTDNGRTWTFNGTGWVLGYTTATAGGDLTGTYPSPSIATGAVTSAKIADGTIATGDIADAAITTAKIADGTIATGDIADSAVTSAKIADATIATGDIADSAVTSAKIADATIVAGDIASSAVTTVKIADDAVTSAKIADGTIAAGDIGSSAVTTAKIADSAVTAAKSAQPVVSTLPTTGLVDGMEVVYQTATMAGLGVAWTFKYRSAASTYKWEFVGGAPLYNTTTGGSATCSSSFTNYTPSNYAQVTPPLAGLYTITGSIRFNTMTQASATLVYHNLVDTNGTTIFSSQYASPGVSQFGTYYPGGMDTVTVQGQYLSTAYALRTGLGSFAAGNTITTNLNGVWIQPIAC